ncbi:hypothetical protein ESCO_002254 [Escovopsis weberi]|uniref:Uncharacterized protein n=1 Tax=Escovopsis weberi TaxID=150374 RepID=A0A0M8MZ28_ESCWE|nr:hypothetical protein ESCO_002254 [Escovopsis weberi]
MSTMYRFMIPPAHLQGLWVGSYFAGLLVNDPSKAVGDSKAVKALQYETVAHSRFCRWRYPTNHRFPAFIFDAVSYWDMLMRDIGLIARRKRSGGLLSEITSPYGTWDYSSVNDEWEERYRKEEVDG